MFELEWFLVLLRLWLVLPFMPPKIKKAGSFVIFEFGWHGVSLIITSSLYRDTNWSRYTVLFL